MRKDERVASPGVVKKISRPRVSCTPLCIKNESIKTIDFSSIDTVIAHNVVHRNGRFSDWIPATELVKDPGTICGDCNRGTNVRCDLIPGFEQKIFDVGLLKSFTQC